MQFPGRQERLTVALPRPAHQGIRERFNACQGHHYYAGLEPIKEPVALDQTGVDTLIGASMDSKLVLARGVIRPALFVPDPIVAEAKTHPSGKIIIGGQPDFPDSFER